MISKQISYKNKYGKYSIINRVFSDDAHFSNWYRKFSKFNKIIGVE